MQFPLSKGPQAWNKRSRSPGLKWYRGYDTLESLKNGRVLVIDYVKQDQTKVGRGKVAAQEINSIDGLRKLYANPDRCGEAVLRVMHCRNAHWATSYLIHKFNITPRDDLVGTDFGKYVKYKRLERRGGKPFLSAKSWKTTQDPWRGVSRTSFGLDYLKRYQCSKSRVKKAEEKDKMFELHYYDEGDQPKYGWDVYVQRLSCYIQHKEAIQDVLSYLESPYEELKDENNPHRYVPDLQSLDNGNTIIIFENSQSGSIEDTAIAARQQWESRWRRLPFNLAYESHDVSNDDAMALECIKTILQDAWKSIAESGEDFLDIRNTHVSILEEKIYEQPADESRAPELWTNSSMWLKVERLASIHEAVVNEMQNNLMEFLSKGQVDEDWLLASPGDLKKISDLIKENLTKPTANLANLMYKSVGIRDSRHGLQLNTSMWRLSSITFVFLSLTFISSFFGMNVDIFQYRGIYEHFFFELAISYPRLWSRSGPNPHLEPQTTLDRLKWRLVTLWNDPAKTVRAGTGDEDAEYDDLGAWSRFKRTLTRRWTAQIRVSDREMASSTTTLGEGGGGDPIDHVEHKEPKKGAKFIRTAATGDLPGGMLEALTVPMSTASTFMEKQTIVSRPSSAGSQSGSSAKRNSGVMVEEEPSTWLKDYGAKVNAVTRY